MGIYDTYSKRSRVRAGVALKKRQNEGIYRTGLKYSDNLEDSILEIGPGDGYISALAARDGKHYLAIEGSPVVATRIREQGHHVRDGYVPPLPADLPGPFSCCFLLHVLEHMSTPVEASRLVEEIFGVLRPGGVLVIACPDYAYWGSRFFDCDYTHSRPVTRRNLHQLLIDHGFEVALETLYVGSFFGYRWIPISWIMSVVYPAAVDRLIGRWIPGDVLNRGVLTFKPNLLFVARRPL